MGNPSKIFKVPERSKIENTTVPGSGTYPDVEQTIPGRKNGLRKLERGRYGYTVTSYFKIRNEAATLI